MSLPLRVTWGDLVLYLSQFVARPIRTIAPPAVAALVLRLALAVPFWRSGINKWDGFLQLNDVAVLLFSEEFRLHLPGGPYPYPAPAVVAFLVASAEICLPILLVLGLAARASALAILLMTVVIQLTVPDGWPIHLTWAAMALGIMALGPGSISLDHWLYRFLSRKPPTGVDAAPVEHEHHAPLR